MKDYVAFNQEEFDRWLSDRGDATHRLNYNLSKDSIVFDLGGYKGEWATKILQKYGSKIYIFEPVHKFFEDIKRKFNENPKINCYEFGLGAKDESMEISLTQDSSSVFNTDGDKETISIKSLTNFLNAENISNVDLLKINIEGGEYDLLEDLIINNKLSTFKNIQIQFHRFIPECAERRNKIREELLKTHDLTYNYEFIWENWTLKQ